MTADNQTSVNPRELATKALLAALSGTHAFEVNEGMIQRATNAIAKALSQSE